MASTPALTPAQAQPYKTAISLTRALAADLSEAYQNAVQDGDNWEAVTAEWAELSALLADTYAGNASATAAFTASVPAAWTV